jgi:hypothetical protein
LTKPTPSISNVAYASFARQRVMETIGAQRDDLRQ